MKKTTKKPPPRPKFAPAKTGNGRLIQEALEAAGRDPRAYRDWAIIIGSRLIDWIASYEVKREDGSAADFDARLLVHKRDLHKIIGSLSERWWHRKLNRRVQQKGPKR